MGRDRKNKRAVQKHKLPQNSQTIRGIPCLNKQDHPLLKTPFCKNCLKKGHYKYQCFLLPKTPINRNKQGKIRPRGGKHYKLWNECRRDWIQKNTNASGTWGCYYCKKLLTIETLTLDHYHPRGSHPELRYIHSNLVPCCWSCQSKKGSIDGDKYMKKVLDTIQ